MEQTLVIKRNKAKHIHALSLVIIILFAVAICFGITTVFMDQYGEGFVLDFAFIPSYVGAIIAAIIPLLAFALGLLCNNINHFFKKFRGKTAMILLIVLASLSMIFIIFTLLIFFDFWIIPSIDNAYFYFGGVALGVDLAIWILCIIIYVRTKPRNKLTPEKINAV